jgi:hypothetical protein
MTDTSQLTAPGRSQALDRIADLLHEAGQLHGRTYRITNEVHDDWASWYANWLIELSELPEVLGTEPVQSELVYLLVLLDKDFRREQPARTWEQYYAPRILAHFS